MANREPAPFGALLLHLRAAAGLTQEQLAARAGLSTEAIAALERGKRRAPRAGTVERLATALGLGAPERKLLSAAARSAEEVGAPERAPVRSRAEPSAAGGRGGAGRDRRQPWWLAVAVEPTPLVDRAHELDTIITQLGVAGVHLLTLTGPAGVGKTRLALAAAARLADGGRDGRDGTDPFPDGVAVVDLSTVRDPQLVLPTIARTFGLTDTGHPPLPERLHAFLRGREGVLVVLDNVEQVLPAAATLLADLVAASPRLSVLVTSRVPLRVRWEQTLRIAPLPVPDLREALPPLEDLLTVPSVALFVGRARARQADFVLREQQAPFVAQVAAELDGLPLALELAAARLEVLSLPTLARRLGDRLQLLATEAPDRPERQRSLEAAVGWSYDLLSEPEQRLFRCLGVFVGRVSLDALTAVAAGVASSGSGGSTGDAKAGDAEPQKAQAPRDDGRTLPRLLSLAEKSLLLPLPTLPDELDGQQAFAAELVQLEQPEDEDDAEPAFGMLETVREYAEGQLVAAGELAAARRAHARYFTALAGCADAKLRGRDQWAWFLRLEREHANLRAALRWLLDHEDPTERERALRLARALGWFWFLRGYHTEGRRWLEEALARAPQEGMGEEADSSVRCGVRLYDAVILVNQGEVAEARAILDEVLRLAQQRHDGAVIVWSLAFLGLCALYSGEADRAVALLDEAVRQARELGEPYHLGLALMYLGVATELQGNVTAAAAHEAEALDHLAAAGDARIAGVAHFNLGRNLGQRGDMAAAVRHLHAGLEASARLRDRRLLSYGAEALLAVAGKHCEPVGYARLLGAADALREAMGSGRAPWEHLTVDPGVAGLRAELTHDEWAAAYRSGRALSAREVVRLALHLLDQAAMPPSSTAAPADEASAPLGTPAALSSNQNPLSTREREVLRLVAEGHSTKTIGQQLFLSPSTINQHVKAIFNKLGVDTRAQAVAVAARRDLL